jgi:hypothetical protein
MIDKQITTEGAPLIDLDVSLLPETIDPFLGRFLALNLFKLFLNSIPHFG